MMPAFIPHHRRCAHAGLIALVGAVGGLAIACGPRPAIVEPEACPRPTTGIFGRVVDRAGGEPVVAAVVRTEPNTNLVLTDANGCFVIDREPSRRDPRLRKGDYTVIVEPHEQQARVRGEPQPVPFNRARLAPFEYDGTVYAIGVIEVSRDEYDVADMTVILDRGSSTTPGERGPTSE